MVFEVEESARLGRMAQLLRDTGRRFGITGHDLAQVDDGQRHGPQQCDGIFYFECWKSACTGKKLKRCNG